MIHFEVDHERCLRSQGINCRMCVDFCVMRIMGIKENRVTVSKPEECIFCTTCQGNCYVDENVIKLWDDENPSLTPVPVTVKKLAFGMLRESIS